MKTKLIYLPVPLLFSGCQASLSHDASKKLADQRGLNGKILDAAGSGSLELMIDLLKRGADINTHNTHDETALHLAAKEDHLACVKALIEGKADVNVRNNRSEMALHVAAQSAILLV